MTNLQDAKRYAIKLLNVLESMEFQLIYPLDIEKRTINYTFGHRRDKYDHEGIDFFAPSGTPVLATADGVVDKVYTGRYYGKCIRIVHTVGDKVYKTYSAHLSKRLVKRGDKVEQGDVIGLSGNTGNSAAPHFHLTLIEVANLVRLRGIGLVGCVDPAQFGPLTSF